jgi:hypothetical protein
MNAPLNGKLIYWLLGLLGTLVTGTATGWLTSSHATSRLHGEKIAVLESQMADQRSQLERIDSKIDRLLERQKGTP